MKRNNVLRETPLLRLAVCLMLGIVVGDRVEVSVVGLFAALAMGVVGVALLGRWARVQTVMIGLCFVVLGMVLTERQKRELRVAWPTDEVCFEAVVVSEPVEKPKTMAVDILLTGSGRKLKCYLHKDGRSRSLRIGDGLQIQSRIEANRDWRRGTFDYRRYLETHGFTGSVYVPSWKWQKAQVSLTGLSRLQRTQLRCLQLRSRLLQRLSAQGIGDAEPYAVVAAMALGDKSALTAELKEVYAVTGASHVLALSGLHLGIIYSLLSLLVVGRRWRMFSQVLLIVSIWAFVLLVGMPMSVVRAAVMLSVYALLSLGHRDRMSVNTLAFTAIAMLLLSPLSLFDVGFQMSFMAVFSILVFMPLFESLLPPHWLQRHRLMGWLYGLAAVSMAAQMGVAPLIAYYFGRFSTWFLLTNLVVIPAATLILYLSVAVLVAPMLANLLYNIVGLLHTVLLQIASLPGASIEGLHPSALQVAMVYVIIAAVRELALRLTCSRASAGYR